MIRLAELVRDLPVRGTAPGETQITGIAHDSRRVSPGDLYVTWVGQRYNGHRFVDEAVSRGAVAVLGSQSAPDRIEVPWLTAADPRGLLAPLAERLYGHPDRELTLVGVTGTNGKTTITHIVQRILSRSGRPAGVLGTLGYRFGDLELGGERTTPEASDLFRALRAMRASGAQAAAMEVSSHALDLDRVEGIAFDVAVFTNLSQDHLDHHRSLDAYFAAKRRIFDHLKEDGRAVVNVDDAYGRRLADQLPDALTYGEGGAVSARDVELDWQGLRGWVVTPRGELPLTSRMLGGLNLSNLLAAVAVAEALELPHRAVAEAIANQPPLPGRMEAIQTGEPFPILLDYAHTDAALEAVLRDLKEMTGDRICLVFGCGGERDRAKRAPMGRVAGTLAELPILTLDNPRGEDPESIFSDVEEGLKASGNRNYRIVPDRAEAIRQAVAMLVPGWALLVAGKGHEQVQILADRTLPYSDREELLKALEARFGRAARG